MKLNRITTNGRPLSVNRYAGMPDGTIQRSKNKFSICVEAVLHAGKAYIKFDYRSAIARAH